MFELNLYVLTMCRIDLPESAFGKVEETGDDHIRELLKANIVDID